MSNPSIDSPEGGFLISRLSPANGGWYVGRAGMEYRDLIPGRLGGRFIASHIRILEGGETQDYVHYHKALFQVIYCKTGWARLVYEDQGPPFLLEAGDCVSQPPEIRHRVLESSAGLEVVEVACPAEYETGADNELELPTRMISHRACEAKWGPWRLDGFEARDTGVTAATNGLAATRVVKSNSSVTAPAKGHAGELLFLFILQGEISIESRGLGRHRLLVGDSCVIPAGLDYTLQAGSGLEMLEVSMPAELPQENPDC